MTTSSDGDIVDISEQLKFDDVVIQSQGFSLLLNKLKIKSGNQKNDKHFLNIAFECLTSYGPNVLGWFFNSWEQLVNEDILTTKDIFEEVLVSFDKIKTPVLVLRKVIEVCNPSVSEFLKIAKKTSEHDLVTIFTDSQFAERHIKYAQALLFSDLLSLDAKQRIGNQRAFQSLFLKFYPSLHPCGEESKFNPKVYLSSCSEPALLQHNLKGLGIFDQLKLLNNRRNFLKNKNLRMNIVFLPTMISIMQSEQQILKALNSTTTIEELTKIRQMISECQNLSKNESEHVSIVENIRNSIISEERVGLFVDFVNHYFNDHELGKNEVFLPLVASLLPFCKNDEEVEKICNLIVKFVSSRPNHANLYVLYFITLFAKPFFKIQRNVVIETLANLAVNRFVISPIVKFFCAMSQHPIPEQCKFYECLGKLVEKYPTIYDSILPILNFPPSDSTELFVAKLNLAKICCISRDECDNLLSILSKLLKEDSPRLALTIGIVHDLCKHDVLEFKSVRKQLLKKVAKNDVARVAYCYFLELGIIDDKDETEESNSDLREQCIKELYNFIKNDRKEIAEEAWKSLGEYKIEEIVDVLKISINDIVTSYPKMDAKERSGLIEFLKKCISKEVEGFPRPFYNLSNQKNEVVPIFSNIDSYKDSMFNKYKEDAWFWKSTLPLVSPILQLSSSSNKALTAIRLIRSCATNVLPSTSHEDMLELFASWRICVREALHSLAESRNNDIIWARDQICEEGRRCLIESQDSVDNVIMMLTVLVDGIEESLKNIDDPKQIEQITTAQTPWIISVFEFCATRLPKDMKTKREQKVNPIYQIMTKSTKASLHIAIFSIRLLYQNPSVLEFYGDGKELGIMKDSILDALVVGTEEKLTIDQIPNRKMHWIGVSAYGVNPLTAETFENEYSKEIESKNEISESLEELLQNMNSSESVKNFFEALSFSSQNDQVEFQAKSKKVVEKLWTHGDDEIKKAIYIGLSKISLTLLAGKLKNQKTVSPDKLPENSVLRHVLHIFEEKYQVDENGKRDLLKALVGHKRKDGRYLPPIGFEKLLERSNWENGSNEIRNVALRLGCEQKIEHILYKVFQQRCEQDLEVFCDHFNIITKVLPRKDICQLIGEIIRNAREHENKEYASKMLETVSRHEKSREMRFGLLAELPNLEDIEQLTDPVLNVIEEPDIFVEKISRNFDFWAEARKKSSARMSRIAEIFSKEDNESKRDLMMAMISYESASMDSKRKIEKVLDVISASRISRSNSTDMSAFLPIVLSLIVSPSHKVNIPVFFSGKGLSVRDLMCSISKEFIDEFIEIQEMRENAKHVISFLLYYIHSDEVDIYEKWQTGVAKDLFLRLVAKYSKEVMPLIENQEDLFWEALFCD